MNFIYYLNTIGLKKEEFDKAVSQVLNKSEYRSLRYDYVDIAGRIRNTLMEWIKRWLEGLFNAGDKLDTSTLGISNGIVIVGSIFLVFLVIILFFSMKKIVGKNKKVKIIYGEEIGNTTTAEGLRNKAAEYKEHGNYREAIRVSFISLLLKMSEKNLLFLDETKTNSEMIQILTNNDFEYIELFENLTYLFNKAWFGHKKIHEDEYGLWEKNMDELWNGVLVNENKG